ncbi:RNA-binding ATPase activator esf2 [Ascosphaera acerosa]|nr:RNA-binding ATPase activator esf2 [Ascosphaera acerosa]
MSARKRNEFLDIESDEGSDHGYDSEAAEEVKGKGTSLKSEGRAAKRRRLSTQQHGLGAELGLSDASEDEEDEGYDSEEHISKGASARKQGEATGADRETGEDDETAEPPVAESEADAEADAATDTTSTHAKKRRRAEPSAGAAKTAKDRLKSEAKKAKAKKDKTGVIYLSSLPPYLKPSALKTLLVQRGFGPITRVFLTPANSHTPAGRKANKRKMYGDGWVEFASKKTAKICAQALNAQIVGGKKGGWYHDDVWNMKYLKGFKWADLMEQIQRERSEREAKQRIEDARAKKEEKMFLAGVEKGKALAGIIKKKEEKGDAPKVDVRRVFRQNKVVADDERTVAQVEAPKARKLDESAKRVLSQIF